MRFFICFTLISILQCAKICFSKFASDRRNLLQPRRKPAILNNLSTPAVVARSQRTFRVILHNRGKTAFCCSRYRNTSLARLQSKYIDTVLRQRGILFYFCLMQLISKCKTNNKCSFPNFQKFPTQLQLQLWRPSYNYVVEKVV